MQPAANQKILACIAADASAITVMTQAARAAQSCGASWIALYVETPELARLPVASRQKVLDLLQQCAELGAETYTLGSIDIAQTILAFAQTRGVTRIIVGAPTRHRWLRRLGGSMIETLIDDSRGVIIEIIPTPASSRTVGPDHNPTLDATPFPETPQRKWPHFLLAACLVLMASIVGAALQGLLPSASLVMLYLIAALLSGLYLGRGPAVLAALGGSLLFNLLFTEPRYTLHIYQLADVVNFAALLTTGLVVAQLSARARHQARVAVQREERAVSIGAFSGALLTAQGSREIAQIACEHIGRAFDADADLWLRSNDGGIACVSNRIVVGADEQLVRQMLENPSCDAAQVDANVSLQYISISGSAHPLGVLVVRPKNWKRFSRPEPRRALQSYTRQLALALERAQLLQQKKDAEMAVRAEDLRNNLLAGLSHDLRTPLASILGSASALADKSDMLSRESQAELIATIHEETVRMTRLVTNLLEMASLTHGFARLKREWFPIEELIGSVRHRLATLLEDRTVSVVLAPNLPLIFVDGLLFEQVLQNLLENAVKYSAAQTPIEIAVWREACDGAEELRFIVADRGIGVPPESRHLIFEKFHRASNETAQSGVGLGLALCKSIVLLHGGSIGMEPRDGGGSAFWVSIPVHSQPAIDERFATS